MKSWRIINEVEEIVIITPMFGHGLKKWFTVLLMVIIHLTGSGFVFAQKNDIFFTNAFGLTDAILLLSVPDTPTPLRACFRTTMSTPIATLASVIQCAINEIHQRFAANFVLKQHNNSTPTDRAAKRWDTRKITLTATFVELPVHEHDARAPDGPHSFWELSPVIHVSEDLWETGINVHVEHALHPYDHTISTLMDFKML